MIPSARFQIARVDIFLGVKDDGTVLGIVDDAIEREA